MRTRAQLIRVVCNIGSHYNRRGKHLYANIELKACDRGHGSNDSKQT